MSRMTRPSIVRMLRRARVAPLELLGVGIALVPDQRDLADPHVRLAQGYAPRLGEAHQALACAMHQLGVRRKGNRLVHPAYATHAAAARHRRSALLLGSFGDHGLRRDEQASDGRGILERGTP